MPNSIGQGNFREILLCACWLMFSFSSTDTQRWSLQRCVNVFVVARVKCPFEPGGKNNNACTQCRSNTMQRNTIRSECGVTRNIKEGTLRTHHNLKWRQCWKPEQDQLTVWAQVFTLPASPSMELEYIAATPRYGGRGSLSRHRWSASSIILLKVLTERKHLHWIPSRALVYITCVLSLLSLSLIPYLVGFSWLVSLVFFSACMFLWYTALCCLNHILSSFYHSSCCLRHF